MTQRDNILQELSELESSLVNAGTQHAYQAPVGYFDGLAAMVMNRIKALETDDAAEELEYLSPLLRSVSKQMPYTVPAGFFDNTIETLVADLQNENETAAEELEGLSPLLSGLKKEMPYHVPENYFDQINGTIAKEEVRPVAKVVSFTKKNWFRYAAAAVVVGVIAIGALLFINRDTKADKDAGAVVQQMMKKVSTDEINSFVQLTNDESRDVAKVDPKTEMKDKNDVQELLKDIPEKDIQSFLDDTQESESTNNEDVLMN